MADMQVPMGARCQEASPQSHATYIPCNRAAIYVVKNSDKLAYYMCDMCADHNVHNRGGHIVQVGEKVEMFVPPAELNFEIEAAGGPSDAQFSRVSELAAKLLRAEETVALAEKALKDANAAYRQVAEIDLPQAMLDCGMLECKVAGGAKVQMKTVYRASIPEDNKPAAFAFLTNTGNGAVIKHAVGIAFGREDGNQAARCVDLLKEEFPGKAVTDKESVHPQTLSALVKELIGKGIEVPMDVLGVYTQRYAVVTLPKEKKKDGEF